MGKMNNRKKQILVSLAILLVIIIVVVIVVIFKMKKSSDIEGTFVDSKITNETKVVYENKTLENTNSTDYDEYTTISNEETKANMKL